MCVFFSTFSFTCFLQVLCNLVNSSTWYTASCGGYSSSRYAGRSSGWDHSWHPKKLDKEHEWNCIVCGESNCCDRARCKGCKEHVGKVLHKKNTAADSGKRSNGKGTGAPVDQEAIRGTQHAKMTSLAFRIEFKQNWTDREEKRSKLWKNSKLRGNLWN